MSRDASANVPSRSPPADIRHTALISMEGLSGPGRQLAAFAGAARDLGIRTRVAILHRSGHPVPTFAAALEKLGIEAITIRDDHPLDFAIVRRLRLVLQEDGAQVLESHGYKATAAAWFLRRSGFSIPWISFFHGETSENRKARFYHAIDRRLLLGADRAIVMSERQRRSIGPAFDHVLVVHNAITNLELRMRGDDAQRISSLCESLPRPRIAVVGRLSPEKGVDIFIDACASMAQRGFGFSAIVAGDGPDRAELERQAAPLGARVIFTGHVDDIAALYGGIDLLVIPSRSEGLPNVLLEAIGIGLPVVSTDVGAIAEVLDDETAGIVVPPNDAEALTRAIEHAATRSYAEIGLNARRRIAERFSLDSRTQRLASLIRDIAAQPTRPGNE
jgi:glycosyltransferase involved in cell wall biosynthesis